MAEGGADPRGAGPPGEASGSEPFADFAARWHAEVERALDDMLPGVEEPPADLHRAMRYALFPGGKRLRPTLALLGARVSGGDLGAALRPSAALECLHTYSLIHDDLPCMDDDELRRGRPTCHVEFGDALAVLTGDALFRTPVKRPIRKNLASSNLIRDHVILQQQHRHRAAVNNQSQRC